MRFLLPVILSVIQFLNLSAQISFSPVNSKLTTISGNRLTDLVFTSKSLTVSFRLHYNVAVLQQNNLARIDSQVIQVTALEYGGFKKDINPGKLSGQEQILGAYTNYELDYFKNKLGIEVINASHQWVETESRGWFIWYFKVGSIPTPVDRQMQIQLFASTVIGNKILTINAPVLVDGNFEQAGRIVNNMMETLTIIKQ